jgi:hypothetical protein
MQSCTAEQKSDLARYLIIAINFIREIISAFCLQQDRELKIKLWVRLGNLVTLQQKLVAFVTEYGNVLSSLPFAYTLEHADRAHHIFGTFIIFMHVFYLFACT